MTHAMQIGQETAYQDIRCDLDGGVLWVTLNRPDKLNAYTPRMGAELLDVFDRADADDGVRVVVITGAGSAFCAGAELDGGPDRFTYDVDRPHEDPGGKLTLRMMGLLKPVIVAFNGAAVGIGATMPLAADIRIASDRASFVFPFVRIGIVPEAASAWFLPTIVGVPRALEWTLTGRRIGSEEALDRGLVHSVHTPDSLIDAALQLAHEIADNTSPVSVAYTRQLIWRLAGDPGPARAHVVTSAGMKSRGASADAKEGIRAFLEKRTALFPDRVSENVPDF